MFAFSGLLIVRFRGSTTDNQVISVGWLARLTPSFNSLSSINASAARVPRDPKSPQTRSALWEPLHDWTQLDAADTFSCLAGGEPGDVSLAGHGRIKCVTCLLPVVVSQAPY